MADTERCATAEGSPSARSLRGLARLNFLIADMRDGIGSYLSVFLQSDQHWQSWPIGLAMAAGGVAAGLPEHSGSSSATNGSSTWSAPSAAAQLVMAVVAVVAVMAAGALACFAQLMPETA